LLVGKECLTSSNGAAVAAQMLARSLHIGGSNPAFDKCSLLNFDYIRNCS